MNDRMLEMTSNALTNVGKHDIVTSNIACAHSQKYTNNSFFWLAQIQIHCFDHNFLPFVKPYINLNALTDGLLYVNWQIDNQFVEQSLMTFGTTKARKIGNVVMHNAIWANQTNKSFVYPWLGAYAMVDIACFPAFVKVSNVISSVVSIRSFLTIHVCVAVRHNCHSDENCPPCTELTQKMCMGNHVVCSN